MNLQVGDEVLFRYDAPHYPTQMAKVIDVHVWKGLPLDYVFYTDSGNHITISETNLNQYILRYPDSLLNSDSYNFIDEVPQIPQQKCQHLKYRIVPLVFSSGRVCRDCDEYLGDI